MDNQIELISDGDGLAVIGDERDVELFLVSAGLASRDLGLPRLKTILSAGSVAANAGSIAAANSGRWVKLTEKSVELINQFGLMAGSKSDLSRGVVQASGGKIKGIVEFVQGPVSTLTSPAVLSGIGGIMSQMAMKQQFDDINEYLAVIDEKVDDIIRSQKNAVIADMIGVDFVIEEAMTVREQVGGVSEVTWSKVQATSMSIARTQAYILRELDAIAEKMERKASMDSLEKTTAKAKTNVQAWLPVLARTFQLQEALAILELDRVLNGSPEELDKHRLGLKAARENRLSLISRTTDRLMVRMDAAAGIANKNVLLHPLDSQAAVRSIEHVATNVVRFRDGLGITSGRESLEAKRWLMAVVETRDEVLKVGAEGIEAAGRFGAGTFERARSATDKLAIKLSEGAARRSQGKAGDDKVDV